MDVDEFVAAVEVLRRPELAGLPVVVGGRGDPTERGVVATASYEARRFGVHSGTPLRTALRMCPDAVFLPLDRAAYEAASQEVMNVLRGFTDELEVWGWDEAFLSVGGDAESVATSIRQEVAKRTGLSCSVGIGDNKLRAKIAVRFAKPGGVYRLGAKEWFGVMGDRPVAELWGIGRKTARRLRELSIDTVRELAAADPERLTRTFGRRSGPWLLSLARGEDDSPVSGSPRLARSRSVERTFQEDVEDAVTIGEEVRRMVDKLAQEAGASDRLVREVAVKIRFAPFTTRTRSVRVKPATAEQFPLREAAATALERFEMTRPVRLVGVRTELQ